MSIGSTPAAVSRSRFDLNILGVILATVMITSLVWSLAIDFVVGQKLAAARDFGYSLGLQDKSLQESIQKRQRAVPLFEQLREEAGTDINTTDVTE